MALVARPRTPLTTGGTQHRAALPSGAMVDGAGEVTSQWRGFFNVLFNRTGGGWGMISSGAGVPTFTAPVGAIFSRTDGTIGATVYVSAGGGTWNAIAGV